MKGVYQDKKDNCVQACVASILELPLEAIPQFGRDTWFKELQAWLYERGWDILNIAFYGGAPKQHHLPQGYTLGGIKHKKKHMEHCVVCYKGKIVWDPIDGEKPGTEYADAYTLILPLDLSKIGETNWTS